MANGGGPGWATQQSVHSDHRGNSQSALLTFSIIIVFVYYIKVVVF